MPSALWAFEGRARLVDGDVVMGSSERMLADVLARRFAGEGGDMGLIRITIERIEEVGE